jgi:hypothetical protein
MGERSLTVETILGIFVLVLSLITGARRPEEEIKAIFSEF